MPFDTRQLRVLNGADFEALALRLAKGSLGMKDANRRGKPDEPDQGVDIEGFTDAGRVGVQCTTRKVGVEYIKSLRSRLNAYPYPLESFILMCSDMPSNQARSNFLEERGFETGAGSVKSLELWDPDRVAEELVQLEARPPLNLWGQPPHSPEDVFRLLDWRTRLTQFDGRSHEFEEAITWATNGNGTPQARLVTGPGGAGKTRFAAEVCDTLWQLGWRVQFLEPGDHDFNGGKDCSAVAGEIWVVDYPESMQRFVDQFFRRFRRRNQSLYPLRALLLTRQSVVWWRDQSAFLGWNSVIDSFELPLGGIDLESTVGMFRNVWQKLSQLYGLQVPEIPEGAIAEWRSGQEAMQTETNALPLYIVAAALHTSLEGSSSLSLSGSQIVRSLAKREQKRLKQIGEEVAKRFGFTGSEVDPSWVARLQGLAALVGRITPRELRLLSDEGLGLRLPPPRSVVDIASRLPIWKESRRTSAEGIAAPQPDILAAALLQDVLSASHGLAPEWIWAAVEHQARECAPDFVDRVSRLVFDAANGNEDEPAMIDWFVEMVEASPDRAAILAWMLEDERPPDCILPLILAIGRILCERSESSDRRLAMTLLRHSTHLIRASRSSEARHYAEDAVRRFRSLAQEQPGVADEELGKGLHRCALALHDCGEASSALTHIEEAIVILRGVTAERRSAGDTAAHHELAMALNNYGLVLQSEKRMAEAEGAYREELSIYAGLLKTKLTIAREREYEDSMARAYHNLSNVLSGFDRSVEAVEAVRIAVEIRRRLHARWPFRYARYLALSLSVLASHLEKIGAVDEAIIALSEAASLHRILAKASPSEFGKGVVSLLSRKLALITASDKRDDYLSATLEIGAEYKTLLESGHLERDTATVAYVAGLLGGNVGYAAVEKNLPDIGIKGCTLGIELLQRFRKTNPLVWSGELQFLLGGLFLNRANALRKKTGARADAIEGYSRAVEFFEGVCADDGFHGRSAVGRVVARTNRTIELLKDGQKRAALRDWRVVRELAEETRLEEAAEWPTEDHHQWQKSLVVLRNFALTVGEPVLVAEVGKNIRELLEGFQRKQGGERAALCKAFVREGEDLTLAAHKEAALDSIREGVRCGREALAAGSEPTAGLEKSSFLNALGYGLAMAVDLGDDPTALSEAEQYLREALEALPHDEATLARVNALDSLGYCLAVKRELGPSSETSEEASALLEEALAIAVAVSATPRDIEVIESHLRRVRGSALSPEGGE